MPAPLKINTNITTNTGAETIEGVEMGESPMLDYYQRLNP